MPFWTRPWDVHRQVREPALVMRQNHHYLELGGEPCFLLTRLRQGNAIAKDASAFTLDPEIGHYSFDLWVSADGEMNFPDPRTVAVEVSPGGGPAEPWEQAFDLEALRPGERDYTILIWRGLIDEDENDVPDVVKIILNTPPFDPAGTTVEVTFKSISSVVDFHSFQPALPGGVSSLSKFGFEQFTSPEATYQDDPRPNAFLLAFPETPRNFELEPRGLVLESRIHHWTSPSPLSPAIGEHDVIVRQTNGLRYEVVNKSDFRIGERVVSQQFDIVEVHKSHAIQDVEVLP